jgi:hypothetical protein
LLESQDRVPQGERTSYGQGNDQPPVAASFASA